MNFPIPAKIGSACLTGMYCAAFFGNGWFGSWKVFGLYAGFVVAASWLGYLAYSTFVKK